jgi:undecaprenyl-diphosphatase
MNNKSYFKKASLSFVLLLLLLLVAIALFGYIMHEILHEKEEALDNQILSFVATRLVTARLTKFMKVITYFGSATILQISFGALVAGNIVLKKFRTAFEISVIGIGGFLLTYFMKLTFQRVRPPEPLIPPLHNFSFPSGHATSAFIFYGLLAFLIWQTRVAKGIRIAAGFLLISFAILIGLSRVYLRVHYPSDVVAGFCVGYSWLAVAIWTMRRFYRNDQSL